MVKINFFKDLFEQGKLAVLANGGVYEIKIIIKREDGIREEAPLYFGQSYCVLARCAMHLYKTLRNSNYLGFQKDLDKYTENEMELKFELIASEQKKAKRLELEKTFIMAHNPLTQYKTSDKMLPSRKKIEVVSAFLYGKNAQHSEIKFSIRPIYRTL